MEPYFGNLNKNMFKKEKNKRKLKHRFKNDEKWIAFKEIV